MSTRVEWTGQALRDVCRLGRPIRERVLQAVERLAATGDGDVVRLAPPLTGFRLRVGDWRVSFERDTDEDAITIRRVRQRREAYRAD